MNTNQDKINKIITVLDTLLAKCPSTTTQQQQEQQTLADLVNKLKQEELKDLESLGSLGDTFLQEKSQWLAEKAQLDQAKKDAESVLASEKKKLGEELVKKLADLAKDEGTDPAKLTELKTLLESLKSEKKEATLSEAHLKTLAEEIAKQPKATNYWSIGAGVFAGLTFLVVITNLFIKTQPKKEEAKN